MFRGEWGSCVMLGMGLKCDEGAVFLNVLYYEEYILVRGFCVNSQNTKNRMQTIKIRLLCFSYLHVITIRI
jgi:hypothetical protein